MKRFLLIACAALLLVPMLAAAGIWVWLDPAMVKGRLQDAALRATGRVVSIDGPVTLTWGFTPGLRAERLRLANPPGLSRPDMARVEMAELGVAVLPLLSGRVVLRGVRLKGADVLLERDAAGRGNWERPAAPDTPPIAAPGLAPVPGRRMNVVLDSAVIEDVTLGLLGLDGAQTVNVRSMTLSDGRRVSGTVAVNGIEVALTGDGPWPLSVRASTPRLVLAPGRVLEALVLTAAAAGPDAPIRLDGQATLGGLPVSLALTAASLPAAVQQGRLDTARLSLGDASVALQGFLDIRGRNADFDIQARIPALSVTAAALGQTLLPLQNLVAEMHLKRVGAGALLAGKVVLDGADAVVDLGLGWPRPSLEGTVQVGRIDLDRLLTLPAVADAGPKNPNPAPPAAVAPATAPKPIPWAALRRADGNIRLTIGTMRWRGTDMTAVDAHGVLARGRLSLDPVKAVVGGGPIAAQLVAKAEGERVTLSVTAPGSAAAAVLALAGLPAIIAGPLEMDAALEATGADTAALLQTATGHIGMAMVGGEADLSAIPGLAQVIRGALVPMPARSAIRCAALQTVFDMGRAQIGTMLLDSPRLSLTGDGSLAMADRTMALRLRPVLALGSTSVALPLRVSGPWAAPAVKMEAESGRAQISIGESGADSCAPALLLARNGRAGAMPPSDPKPPRPADLLRGLLR